MEDKETTPVKVPSPECQPLGGPQSVTFRDGTGVPPASGLCVCVSIERLELRSKGPFGAHVILCLLVLFPRVKRHFLWGYVSVPRPGMFRILHDCMTCGFGAK